MLNITSHVKNGVGSEKCKVFVSDGERIGVMKAQNLWTSIVGWVLRRQMTGYQDVYKTDHQIL